MSVEASLLPWRQTTVQETTHHDPGRGGFLEEITLKL